jgi:hypothetical protein
MKYRRHLLRTPHSKSLDASGGSVFRKIIGPAMLDRMRAAASTQTLDFAMVGLSKMTFRSILAAVIFGMAMIASASAQELRNRELKPDIDLTTIQMPVEIVTIKLNGKEMMLGEKIKGDDDWLKGVSFTVKNISGKPIAYVAVGLRFEPPPGAARLVVFTLSYGVDNSRGVPRSGSSPMPLQPDQTVDLVLTDERYPNFLQILSMGGMPRGFDVVPYYVERVSFEDDPNIIWEGGYLKRKNPAFIGRFDIIERYKLPTKH